MRRREVRFAEGADDDLVRLFEVLADKDLKFAARAIVVIRRALAMAAEFPHSCRRAQGSAFVRECVIPIGQAGYVAAFEIADDSILVLAVRHQREDDTPLR
ncbi:MAG: type II toxin-antitoxin system RelE/ParE family toxin [Myxococcales bacterium]|nr:type II toxin-antitoxin system RelE/ParE family toxin [Myxococcales bacterium]